jgi:arylsulfatase A-like enzyme
MPQPNFIVFLTGDQGYGNLSCTGASDFRTPHLDRLARIWVSAIPSPRHIQS